MNDDTQAPMLLGITGGLLFLSILLLTARLWSRLRPISNFKADDWTVLVATVSLPSMLLHHNLPPSNHHTQILAIANFLLQCTACSYGFGRRARFVSRPNQFAALRLIFITQVIWYWSVTIVKLSVALLLLRLKPSRRWKIFLYCTMTLLIVTVVVQTCFQFLQCRPFAIYWDASLFFKNGGVKCIPRRIINGNIITNSTIQVATDLVFSFVPITFIRKLHRPRGEKIFLSILMGLGLFASTFAILRTVGLSRFYLEEDFFRMNVMPTLYATLEQQVALIAATIPTLKSFMQRALIRIGQYFYDHESEAQIRGRLVDMGFLAIGDEEDEPMRVGRKPSKPDLDIDAVATFGSPRVRKKMDEYGDTVVEEKGDIVRVSVSSVLGKDVGLERAGARER